jgi:hypothetical protein
MYLQVFGYGYIEKINNINLQKDFCFQSLRFQHEKYMYIEIFLKNALYILAISKNILS